LNLDLLRQSPPRRVAGEGRRIQGASYTSPTATAGSSRAAAASSAGHQQPRSRRIALRCGRPPRQATRDSQLASRGSRHSQNRPRLHQRTPQWPLSAFSEIDSLGVGVTPMSGTREAIMADRRLVAATITAALVAHGKGAPQDIADAIRIYRDCLSELAKQSPGEPSSPSANRGPSSGGASLARG